MPKLVIPLHALPRAQFSSQQVTKQDLPVYEIDIWCKVRFDFIEKNQEFMRIGGGRIFKSLTCWIHSLLHQVYL